MITVDIPGYKTLELQHLVMDYNGTLAVDGTLLSGVAELLIQLSRDLTLHVLTADTFGKVQDEMEGLPCRVSILPPEDQHEGKADYVRKLSLDSVVAIGNGRNDRLMLKESALGITLVQEEGAALQSVQSADIVCPSIIAALSLLANPRRLIASLRS